MGPHEHKPLVVAIDMGYGHLRAADALARALDTTVLHADQQPLAQARERRLWGHARKLYEAVSRSSQVPVLGAPLRSALEAATAIPPLYPHRDLSAPNVGVRMLRSLARRGLGRDLVAELKRCDAALLTTFYAPAVLACHHGYRRVFCVVTDVDVNRVWAPFSPRDSAVCYLVPSQRARSRLQAFGVPAEQIRVTGFPLPPELLGGPELPILRRNLASRLVRLDPTGAFREAYRDELERALGSLPGGPTETPLLVFAVGGAGAQLGLVRRFLPSLRPLLHHGRLRLTLVAGIRSRVAERLHDQVQACGLGEQLGQNLEILHEATMDEYLRRFNALLGRADVLWTKPSELTFFGALGLPLLLSQPVGIHEKYNRRWAIENGAGLGQRDPRQASHWLEEWQSDGTLAAAAWSGFKRLPKLGVYTIASAVSGSAEHAA